MPAVTMHIEESERERKKVLGKTYMEIFRKGLETFEKEKKKK